MGQSFFRLYCLNLFLFVASLLDSMQDNTAATLSVGHDGLLYV